MHTPGPWDYSDQTGSRKHCYLGQVWDSEGESLAVLDSTTDPAVATANARLIAAAPDLLAACEDAIRLLDEHRMRGLTYDTLDEAIKKAKGQG